MDSSKDIKRCVLSQLPGKWQKNLENVDFSYLEEIRFRAQRNVMLYYNGKKAVSLEKTCDFADLEEILAVICKNSVYAYRENIAQGFVTLSGGHRAGICGKCAVNDGAVRGISLVSGINIRIARHIKDAANSVMQHILKDGKVLNTIIISPPSAGKTTMLRSIALKLSENFKVSVIDERSEIGAMSVEGVGFDLGKQTDILDSVPKNAGILMALRALSPEVIITDEIDTEKDIDAVKSIIGAGAKIITSAHSESFLEFKNKNADIFKYFDVVLALSRKNGVGNLEGVYVKDDFCD